jgi:hypothetical protein
VTVFVTHPWFYLHMEQIEMAFDKALDPMPHLRPRRYRFAKNALVIDYSDRKLLFGLWDRLHGFWRIDGDGRRVEESVPHWQPLNDQGVWSLDDDAPCQYVVFVPGPGQQNLRREANAAFVAYFDAVPKRIRRLVGGLEGHQWLMLDLIWQVPEFAAFLDDEIHEGRIQYIFACCALANAADMSRAERRGFARSMMRTKRPKFLTRLSGVKCKKSGVRALYKFGHAAHPSDCYLSLFEASRNANAAKVFAHASRIKPRGIESWLKLPNIARLPNILRIAIEVSGDLDELHDFFLENPRVPGKVWDRMGQSLREVRLPGETWEWCFRWENTILDQVDFPKPPFGKHGSLRPLVDAKEMRRESREMNNCLGELIHTVISGNTYFYHWDGPLPATVMLETCSESGWHVGCIFGPGNEAPSQRLVQRITRQVSRQLCAPASSPQVSIRPSQEALFSCIPIKHAPATRADLQVARSMAVA